MPNRIIKESAFTSERIARLTDFEFRLWVGLITLADDLGRGDARPAIVRGRLFPFHEKLTNRAVERALEALEKVGCIERYTVKGKPYFCFPQWEEYQRVRNECQEGRIGELTEVAIRRYGPRVTNEYVKGRVTIGFYMAIHDLDASMWMTGHKITEVFAEKIDKLGLYGEDGLDMVFKYDNGACGTMNVSWTLPAAYPGSVAELDLLGDKMRRAALFIAVKLMITAPYLFTVCIRGVPYF